MGKIRDSIDRERSRRAVLGTLIGAGVAGVSLSPVGDIVAQFAPFSGDVWRAADPNRPGTVRSPYGGATLRYDEEGVPHIEADDEQALYYAAGHTQAIDRGFQMDLQRRLFSGRLARRRGCVRRGRWDGPVRRDRAPDRPGRAAPRESRARCRLTVGTNFRRRRVFCLAS